MPIILLVAPRRNHIGARGAVTDTMGLHSTRFDRREGRCSVSHLPRQLSSQASLRLGAHLDCSAARSPGEECPMSPPTSSIVPNGPEAMAFRHVLCHFPTGVSVVTITDGEDDTVRGMTASAFSPVSLDRRLRAVSVNKPGRVHELLQSTDGYFGLSILRNNRRLLCGAAAGCLGRRANRVARRLPCPV